MIPSLAARSRRGDEIERAQPKQVRPTPRGRSSAVTYWIDMERSATVEQLAPFTPLARGRWSADAEAQMPPTVRSSRGARTHGGT